MFCRLHSLSSLVLSGLYGLAGVVWIFFSDRFLATIARDPEQLTLYQTYKGWGYVVLSTLLVYTLIHLAQRRSARHVAEIRHLNRLHALLGRVNQAIVRSRDIQALFDETCRIAVQEAGFPLVWIGRPDPATGQLKPVARAGTGGALLDGLDFRLDDREAPGVCPAGARLSQKLPFLCPDLARLAQAPAWCARAREFGYHSFVALPIRSCDRVAGVVGFFSTERGGFRAAEVHLFEDLAVSLGLALAHAAQEEARNAAETALRVNEERLRALLAAVPDIVVEVDRNRIYTWSNPAGFAFFGADLLGREARHFFEGEQDTYALVQPLFEGTEDTVYLESWQRRWDGEQRLLAWWCRALWDAEGRVVGLLCSARDITERKQAEQALRASQERFRRALENIPDVVALYGRDLRIEYINASTQRITGRSPAEFIGRRDEELFPPEICGAYLPTLRKTAETRTPHCLDIDLNFPGRGSRSLRITCIPLLDESGAVREILGIAHDHTERKQAGEALRLSEERFRLAMRGANDGLWDWNLDTGAMYYSPRWKSMLGYAEDELEDHPDTWKRLLHPDDLEPTLAAVRALLEGRTETFETEYRLRHKAGHFLTLLSRAFLLRDGGGEPARLVGTHVDITERKRAESRNLELTRALERHNAELAAERSYWRAVIEGIADEVWLSDAQGRMSLVNLPAETRMGLEEFSGKSVEEVLTAVEILDPDGTPRPKDRAPLLRALRGETVRGEEIMRHRETGQRRHRQFSCAPTRNALGEITGAVAIVRDITEAKAVETALRESEARLSLALAASRMGVWEWDVRTDAVFWSPQCHELFGLDQGSFGGTRADFARFLHPEDADRLMAEVDRALTERTVYSAEFRIVRPDGAIRWLSNLGRADYDAAGRPLRLVGTVRDITERVRAEAALQDSEQTLERAQAIARMGSWTADLVQGSFTASPACARLLGWPPGTHGVKALLALLHPEDLPPIRAAWRAALSGAPCDIEHRILLEGRVRWLRVRAELAFDPAGRPVRAVGMAQDVTGMREAQQALEAYKTHLEELVAARTAELRQQARYLRAIIDNVPYLVWLKDPDGRYLAVNRAIAAVAGRPADELLGRTDFDLWPKDQAERYRADDAEVMARRRQKTVEAPWSAEPGAVFETFRTPVLDEDGTVLGTAGFARDVSERKAVEAAREATLAEAERLAQARSAFLADMSHEIRTPLNAVLGLAQVGIRESTGPAGRATFGRILEAGRHLLGVVDEILDFSKIEAGKLELEQDLFTLGDAIDRAVNLVAGRAYTQGLAFQVEEAPDLPERCRGDLLRLAQVLVNLLANAVKFTPAGGRVVLAVGRAGETLTFRVEDTGIGMAPEVVTRLFQPFEQADGSTPRRFGGTGLGLSICKHLVESMGGTIRVDSQPGVGSRFELRLPCSAADAPVRPLPPSPIRVALAGLAPDETALLSRELAARGLDAVTVTAGAAFPAAAALVVATPDAAAGTPAPEGGPPVAVALTPGADDLPAALREGVLVLDRPLRTRHILAALTRPAAGAVAMRTDQARLAGRVVLAAEDNEVNRLVLEDMLRLEGARPVCVANGREALETLQRAGPDAFDLVLTDIQMPELDGYETARRIRALAPGLPVVGLTAHALPEDRARCLAAGMVEHLAKPLDLDALVAVIQRHARRRPEAGAGPAAPEQAPGTAAPHRAAPLETETAPPPACIDWQALESRFGNRPDFIAKLVATVLDSQADTAARLRDAARRGDFDGLAFLAHGLKGLAGNLMADGVRDLAAQAERAARETRPDAAEQALRLADTLNALLAALAERHKG
jgi:PAS domain S-box-containing protein